MKLSVRRFGPPAREMVGVLQSPRGDAKASTRYLLCRPLGQEAVRSAPVFKVLSERLSREGCEVLRFDYHGTGDSPGEEDQQSVSEWADDTLAAHGQLSLSDGPSVNWFGMRLGANVALQAAIRAKTPPRRIVLWDPILNGGAYLAALMEGHRDELVREFGEPWQRLLRRKKVTQPTLPGDILGFCMGSRLANELAQMEDIQIAPALRRGIQITCVVHAEDRTLFADLERNSLLTMQTIESRTNWMSSQAMGTAIVPPDLPKTLLATLK